jgi:hypothetical protein
MFNMRVSEIRRWIRCTGMGTMVDEGYRYTNLRGAKQPNDLGA